MVREKGVSNTWWAGSGQFEKRNKSHFFFQIPLLEEMNLKHLSRVSGVWNDDQNARSTKWGIQRPPALKSGMANPLCLEFVVTIAGLASSARMKPKYSSPR